MSSIQSAVNELRGGFGETLQQFAHRANISIGALCNYLKGRVPEPRQLITLYSLAIQINRDDLAWIIEQELCHQLGVRGVKVEPVGNRVRCLC